VLNPDGLGHSLHPRSLSLGCVLRIYYTDWHRTHGALYLAPKTVSFDDEHHSQCWGDFLPYVFPTPPCVKRQEPSAIAGALFPVILTWNHRGLRRAPPTNTGVFHSIVFTLLVSCSAKTNSGVLFYAFLGVSVACFYMYISQLDMSDIYWNVLCIR
jgi:hypothetical protein